MENKREIIEWLERASLVILGILFVAFPLVFTTLTTDAFILPKQILVALLVMVTLVILAIRMVTEAKLTMRTTPFDLPILVFIIVVFASAVLSVNRNNALIAYVPFLFAALCYYVTVNTAKSKASILFLLGSLVAGAAISSIVTSLSYFKIYLLPFAYTQNQVFNLYGSLLDQALYLALVLPVAIDVAWPFLRPYITVKKASRERSLLATKTSEFFLPQAIGFSIASLIIIVGLGVTVFQLMTTQKPLILPFETGFQTGFAAISQDQGRVATSFFFGTGFGTYLNDFTRFKQATYNANPTLWSFNFFRSSSFVLELLATTGFLGILSYLFIIYRTIVQKRFFLPLIVMFVASFLLPFSFIQITLLFIMLALFASVRGLEAPQDYQDVSFFFLTTKQGLFVSKPYEDTLHKERHEKYRLILPVVFFVLTLAFVGITGYLSYLYVSANMMFQKSFIAASQNDGQTAYTLEQQAITAFPYSDEYYVRFSQLNLALANALSASQPQGSSPSAEVQQNILVLTQQAINAGRSAITVAPQTASNWNNLSSIYRALIGFGENAEQFAELTNQQAIALDPSNPQQYINLGGIYYQLQQWDNAARQFQIAMQLKPDYANAYYNLGHALESKGDLQTALAAYQQTALLIVDDKENSTKLAAEIKVLQEKIGAQAGSQGQQPAVDGQTAQNQPPIAQPSVGTQLPEQNPKVNIPGPTVTVTPAPSPTGEVTPTP